MYICMYVNKTRRHARSDLNHWIIHSKTYRMLLWHRLNKSQRIAQLSSWDQTFPDRTRTIKHIRMYVYNHIYMGEHILFYGTMAAVFGVHNTNVILSLIIFHETSAFKFTRLFQSWAQMKPLMLYPHIQQNIPKITSLLFVWLYNN